MQNLWSETAQGFLKDWNLSKNQQENLCFKQSHDYQEVSWIPPKWTWCDILPSLLPTDSACSPITTLQISHPFHTAPLRTPASFHQTEARSWGSVKLAMQRTTWIQLWKVSNDFEEQTWRNKQLTTFWLVFFKCRADTAYSTKGRSRTGLSYFHEKIKALNSLNKANGSRQDPDGWLLVGKGRWPPCRVLVPWCLHTNLGNY